MSKHIVKARRLLKFLILPHWKKTESTQVRNHKTIRPYFFSVKHQKSRSFALFMWYFLCQHSGKQQFKWAQHSRQLFKCMTLGTPSPAPSMLNVGFLQTVISQLAAGCICAMCKLTFILSVLIISEHSAFGSCAYCYHLVQEHPSCTATQ